MKFDPKDWISPKKALKKIVEMIKVNQERLDDYKKNIQNQNILNQNSLVLEQMNMKQ